MPKVKDVANKNKPKAKTKARPYMNSPKKVNTSDEKKSDKTKEENEVLLELEKLRAENKLLKSGDSPLTKNEEKLLNAVRTEVIKQETDSPIIGRTKLIKEYKINSKYLDEAINLLESKTLIKRTPVKYTAKIMTNSWKILKGN